MKNNKGITLIALVITIIVLLILAGVSIAMLTGDNGILTKATEAGSATDLSEVLERINMELNAQLTNAMAGQTFDTEDEIENNLGTLPNGYTATVAVSGTTSYSTSENVTITITRNPDGVTLTQNIGKVAYDATDKVWEVTPVEGSVK